MLFAPDERDTYATMNNKNEERHTSFLYLNNKEEKIK